MDGKLVWSAAMGSSGGTSAKAPDTVDYLVVKPVAISIASSTMSPGATEVRVARGGSAAIGVAQYNSSSTYMSYVTVNFASDGAIRLSYPASSLSGCISVEGCHYI